MRIEDLLVEEVKFIGNVVNGSTTQEINYNLVNSQIEEKVYNKCRADCLATLKERLPKFVEELLGGDLVTINDGIVVADKYCEGYAQRAKEIKDRLLKAVEGER